MYRTSRRGLPGALRVVRVDVDAEFPDISPERERRTDTPYVGARVIAVRQGRPVGEIDLDLRRGPVPADEVRQELVHRLGGRLAAQAREAQPSDDLLPTATVVMCSTFVRTESLRRSVAAVLAQEYPHFDVVVVDNRPRFAGEHAEHAEVRSWLRTQPRVQLVDQEQPGLSAARNAGATASGGEIIVFIDDDVEMESGWLRAIGTRFTLEPDTDCVTGPILPLELDHPAQRWFEGSGSKLDRSYVPTSFSRAPGARGRRRFLVTANTNDRRSNGEIFIYRGAFGSGAIIAIRAEALAALGGFDEALGAGAPSGGGEDLQLLTRLLYSGRRLTYDPGAAIYHAHRTDFEDLRRTMVAYGSGYTAMLVSLVHADPRHLIGLAHYGLHAATVAIQRRRLRRGEAYPASLARAERRGLLLGPWAYVRSRRWLRAQRRS